MLFKGVIVLSGLSDVVEKVLANLGKIGTPLQVSHSFHPPLMSGMENDFRNNVEGVNGMAIVQEDQSGN